MLCEFFRNCVRSTQPCQLRGKLSAVYHELCGIRFWCILMRSSIRLPYTFIPKRLDNVIMSSGSAADNVGIVISDVVQAIAIFALAGVGIGATGGIAITQLSSGGLLGGVLSLVVLTVVLLLGPVIGLISGLRVGTNQDSSYPSYLSGLVGAIGGYFVMILLVIVTLSLALNVPTGVADTAAQTTAGSGGSSTGISFGQYILPIIAVAVPTGLTGLGGVYLGSNPGSSSDVTSFSTKYVVGGVVLVFMIAAAGLIGPELLSSEPQLEVSGAVSSGQNTLYADGTVTNPTTTEITNVITVELVIDGESFATEQEEVTVPAGTDTEISLEIATVDGLSNSQIQAVGSGQFEIRYSINDQTVETYTA